jgi:hypothetical protein
MKDRVARTIAAVSLLLSLATVGFVLWLAYH